MINNGRLKRILVLLIILLLMACTPNHNSVTRLKYPFDEESAVVIDGDPLIELLSLQTKIISTNEHEMIILEYTIENNSSETVEIGHFSHLEKLVDGTWNKQQSVDVEFSAELVSIEPGESYVDNLTISSVIPELLLENGPDLKGTYRLVKTIEPYGVYELRFEIDTDFMKNLK